MANANMKKLQIHIGCARWHPCDGIFRFLSGTGIDREHDTGTANQNKINTIPYERLGRRDAEDSDGNGLTDTVKFIGPI
jgi:hypothetical protein